MPGVTRPETAPDIKDSTPYSVLSRTLRVKRYHLPCLIPRWPAPFGLSNCLTKVVGSISEKLQSHGVGYTFPFPIKPLCLLELQLVLVLPISAPKSLFLLLKPFCPLTLQLVLVLLLSALKSLRFLFASSSASTQLVLGCPAARRVFVQISSHQVYSQSAKTHLVEHLEIVPPGT